MSSDIVVTTSDFRSRIDFQLAAAINHLGYILSDVYGQVLDPHDLHDTPEIGRGYGILLPHPDQSSKRRLCGILPPKQLMLRMVGVMWLKNDHLQATPERWVFETFGRELSTVAHAAVDLLGLRLGVPIHIHLASDQIKEVHPRNQGFDY